MSAVERIKTRLREADCRGGGSSWTCPAHEDSTPSLSVAECDKGALIHCFAGCTTVEVLGALGLELKDLYEEWAGSEHDRTHLRSSHSPKPWNLPESSIKAVHTYSEDVQVVRFVESAREKGKCLPRHKGPGGRWYFGLGETKAADLPLYREKEALFALREGRDVRIVEGEADADFVLKAGGIATTNAFGAGNFPAKAARRVAAIASTSTIWVHSDRDAAGERHALDVRDKLMTAGVPASRIRLCRSAEGHDAEDHLRAGRSMDEFEEFDAAQAQQPASVAWDASVAPSWPDPLGPAARIGIVGELLSLVDPHTESDPAAIAFQFLAAFGACLDRGAYFAVEAKRHYTNEFVALVGVTSKGRKGTALAQALLPLGRVLDDPVPTVGGLASGEGLIFHVRDPIFQKKPIKKSKGPIEYQEVMVDEGVDDKRLIVVEEEMAKALHVMSRDGSTLSAVIRQAWDGGDLQILTKNSPVRATAPLISIISHITLEELHRCLTQTDAMNGFANRFLWVCVERSKLLPTGGNLESVDFSAFDAALRDAISAGNRRERLPRDAAAEAKWAEVYPTLSEGHPGLFGAAVARGEAHVVRLALLYAVLDKAGEIRLEHLQAALECWRYAEDSARFIFGNSLGDAVSDQLLEFIRASDSGRTRTEIRDLFNRHKSASEIFRALKLLEGLGLVRVQLDQTGGRSAERWVIAE